MNDYKNFIFFLLTFWFGWTPVQNAFATDNILRKTTVPDKVAQYWTGKRGTASFESFSFYTQKSKHHGRVEYSYGEDEKILNLRYLGKTKEKGKDAFKVRFSNGYILTVIPQKDFSLKIKDKKVKYSKRFKWLYEGPVNGQGTFCSSCAEDEKEAMKIIKTYFLP